MSQCPVCYAPISRCDNYCARCGKRLREKWYLRRQESSLLKERKALYCRVCGKKIKSVSRKVADDQEKRAIEHLDMAFRELSALRVDPTRLPKGEEE